jgi:hypothetical protein
MAVALAGICVLVAGCSRVISLRPAGRRVLTASLQRWQACSNGSFTRTVSGGCEVWDVGPISNTNGVLSTAARINLEIYHRPATQQGGGLTAQRVMTVRNDFAIFVLQSVLVALVLCVGLPVGGAIWRRLRNS